MFTRKDKNKIRKGRHLRVRKKVSGTAERPRMNVYRSLSHIYVQLIDDTAGHTLASASSLDAQLRTQLEGLSKKEVSKLVGKTAGERAVSAGITSVVFDRGGYLYTGRVSEVAEGAREAGLQF